MTRQQAQTVSVGNLSFYHFDYEKFGVKGVGKKHLPIINMDKYIDHSRNEELHIEACRGLAISSNYKMGMTFGALPPDQVKKFGGKDCWTQMIKDIEQHDPTGTHRKAMESILSDPTVENKLPSIYKYCYYALGSTIPWYFALYLKESTFQNKTEDNGIWTEDAKLFPKLQEYLKTLPFKTIGRVLFFTTYPNCGVLTHRDSIVADHKDHNINLYFSAGWRPSYIWDEVKQEKIYLESGARSYFFNNRDYHGVDPEPVFRYTLRIDGTFTDELCEELGLEEGYTWRESYDVQK